MLHDKFQNRINQLVNALRSRDIDAVMMSNPRSLGYFTGLFEDPHERFFVLCVDSNGQISGVCPALSATQFSRHGVVGLLPWKDGESPTDLFEQIAESMGLRSSIIAVDASMRADQLILMQEALPAAKFVTAGPIIEDVRSRKDEDEIRLLQRAGAVVDEVFEECMPRLRAGLTELEVESMLRSAILARGVKPTFCIVATGANSAEPHHSSDDSIVRSGEILLIDFGCELEGYQADITRTVHIGPASDVAKEAYDAVYQAHMASFQAVRPGVLASEVDGAGRKVLESLGLADYFIHRTGHGIGLDGHERPNIGSSDHVALEPGNTFSIEPGVYFPGKFGIRLENIVACGVAGNDAVSLNAPISPNLIEL